MEKPFEKIGKHWGVIIFIGGLVVTWTQFDSRLSTVERKVDEQSPISIQLQKDIVEIKTTLEFIKQQLAKQ